MARQWTSTTVTAKFPIKANFICNHCGKNNCTDLVFASEAHETESGYGTVGVKNLLSSIAQQRMNKRAIEVVHDLRTGSLGQVFNESSARGGKSPVVCQSCGTSQLPHWYKSIDSAKGCLMALLFWIPLSVFFILGLVTWVRSDAQFAVLSLTYCILSILIVVLGVLFEKKQSRRASADPTIMKKYYNAVYNDNIEIDFSQYGLGVVRVGGEKNEPS